ncbi:MAG: L,D-transpeptidase family protein [Actinomycetota bacterium]|nr:L,D-transpeptidase family protein [Actinomycetota bacterium]
MLKKPIPSIYALLLCLCVSVCQAWGKGATTGSWAFDSENTVIGFPRTYVIKGGESLVELAPEFDVGYSEIVEANPGVDPWVPGRGTVINIPSFKVLPNAPPEGIVINLAEMRLYYYFKPQDKRKNGMFQDDDLRIISFPVGIGMEGFNTPIGEFYVQQKIKDPAWYVPESIRKEHPELQAEVPPGTDNPLGPYALRLSDPSYLIHGTNRPFGIGRMASHGCIRMYNKDIKRLFNMVHRGTPVNIIYQPVKVGRKDGNIYLEVHRDYLLKLRNPGSVINARLDALVNFLPVNKKLLRQTLKNKTGMPVMITEHPRF